MFHVKSLAKKLIPKILYTKCLLAAALVCLLIIFLSSFFLQFAVLAGNYDIAINLFLLDLLLLGSAASFIFSMILFNMFIKKLEKKHDLNIGSIEELLHKSKRG